jgi:hypothetical protein
LSLPPDDTADLRVGPPIHDDLLALLPLVGNWAGTGVGRSPTTGEDFAYRQQVRFAHDGRRFLSYDSRSWLTDDSGADIRPALREGGFWRPGPGEDDFEVVLAAVTGLVEVMIGTAGDLRWQVATGAIIGTPTATGVQQDARIYALLGEELHYATELALPGEELSPHLNGVLRRE